LWQHDEALQDENIRLRTRESALRAGEEEARRVQQVAVEEAKAESKEGDEALRDGDAKLHKEVTDKTKAIGKLEGELKIGADKDKVLERKLVLIEAQLAAARKVAGNHSEAGLEASEEAGNKLRAELQVAESRMHVLQGELEEKNGDLVVEQSEVEAEKAATGSGATMEGEELNHLRERLRDIKTKSDVMKTRLQKERDRRQIAEAKASELEVRS
jgi:hypothetical protein